MQLLDPEPKPQTSRHTPDRHTANCIPAYCCANHSARFSFLHPPLLQLLAQLLQLAQKTLPGLQLQRPCTPGPSGQTVPGIQSPPLPPQSPQQPVRPP